MLVPTPDTDPIVLSDSEAQFLLSRPRYSAHSNPNISHHYDDGDYGVYLYEKGNLFEDLQDACGVDTSLDIGVSSPNPAMATKDSASFATAIRMATDVLGSPHAGSENKRPH